MVSTPNPQPSQPFLDGIADAGLVTILIFMGAGIIIAPDSNLLDLP